MRKEVFIQARMGSKRLPGKVLKSVKGQPLLHYLLERVARVTQADAIRVLTTTEAIDDAIEAFCKSHGISIFRGAEHDVLSRYYHAAKEHHVDAIVRVTADCPLIDPAVIDHVIEVYCEEYPHWDYISNTLQRTFPRGMDVEICSFAALERAYLEAKEPAEREHVTLHFYRNPEKFHIKNLASSSNLSRHRWTVDTDEDFQLIELILQNLYPIKPQFTLEDILGLLTQHPEWSAINENVEQKAIYS